MYIYLNHIILKTVITKNNYCNLKQEHKRTRDRIIYHIYATKPHPRLMAHCDKLYFGKHGKHKIKKMKLLC